MPGRPMSISSVSPATIADHPGKYADRSGVEVEALTAETPAPEFFSDEERSVWNRIHADCPKGLIARMHRGALIALCLLEAKMMARTINSKDMAQLITLYAKFGMTPADQARVFIPPSKQLALDDEWSQFTQ